MRKVAKALVPFIAALFVLAMTGAASAHPLGGGLQFNEHDTFFHYTDNGSPGPNAGDVFVVRGKLENDGVPIGAVKAVCTLTGGSGRALCNVMFRFGPFSPNADRLFLQGFYNPSQEFSNFSVVGGTNTYAGATGNATRTSLGPTDAGWVVNLN